MNKLNTCTACEAYTDNTRHDTCPDHRFAHLQFYTGTEELPWLIREKYRIEKQIAFDEGFAGECRFAGNVAEKIIENRVTHNVSRLTELTYLISYFERYGREQETIH
jgi:hypothetical protein